LRPSAAIGVRQLDALDRKLDGDSVFSRTRRFDPDQPAAHAREAAKQCMR
jgi:hypothetical protein